MPRPKSQPLALPHVCVPRLLAPAPSRIEWERRLFNGMYDEVRDFDRVKYGGEHGAGCPTSAGVVCAWVVDWMGYWVRDCMGWWVVGGYLGV